MFHWGLKEEIGVFVKLLKPLKLSEAISVARVQETSVEGISRKSKFSSVPTKPLGNLF